MDLVRQAWRIATQPKYSKYTNYIQLLGDAALCGLIVWKVPYTKIDWDAYMQQVSQFVIGERDYAKIRGETGPLVYPAIHVYIYRVLSYMTDDGRDIFLAQIVFVGLYLATLAVVMLCYRQAKVPPYIYPLLSLSKRMHSLFMLRLFNDCFAVFFLFVAIYFYQKRQWTIGTMAYAWGLGVKMSLLLALPAIGMILWQGMGRDRAMRQAASIAQLQMLSAIPFVKVSLVNYLSRAFEFTRQFNFEWTMNWRFIGEETFLSRPFSLFLLAVHAVLLYTFGLSRWLSPANLTLPEAIDQLLEPPPKEVQEATARRVTPTFTLTTILSAVIIGCLCARSLHCQFFVYIAWSTPFLLWRSGLHPVFIYAICLTQEWAWNAWPSTNVSSAVAVACLAVTVCCVWIGTSEYLPSKTDSTTQEDVKAGKPVVKSD